MRPNPQETADLIAFTEKVLNRKLHFLCSVTLYTFSKYWVFLWSRKTASLTVWDDYNIDQIVRNDFNIAL